MSEVHTQQLLREGTNGTGEPTGMFSTANTVENNTTEPVAESVDKRFDLGSRHQQKNMLEAELNRLSGVAQGIRAKLEASKTLTATNYHKKKLTKVTQQIFRYLMAYQQFDVHHHDHDHADH